MTLVLAPRAGVAGMIASLARLGATIIDLPASGTPAPYWEYLSLLTFRGGYIQETPQPFMFTNSSQFHTFVGAILPPAAPAGMTARLVDVSIQLGGQPTGGDLGHVDVLFSVSAMPAPDGVVLGEPAQEVLTAYFTQLVEPQIPTLRTYTVADFIFQAGTALPLPIDPTQGLALYVQVDDAWISPVWIWQVGLRWDFV